MDFSFALPVSNGDLLNSRGDNYFVKHVYSSAELPEKLRECKQMVHQNDPFYIFDHFDTYFSIIENNSTDVSASTNLLRSFDLLFMTAEKLGQNLTTALATSDGLSQQNRKSLLNLTKMTLYLIVSTVKKIDASVHRIQQQQGETLQQKKRGKQAETLQQYPDWDIKRSKFLVQLFNLMQCPLEKLWNPPVPEENFVNLLCDICYRTLEIFHQRPDNRHIGATIFQIFGTAIKRYNHALTFPVRILQLLRNIEHAAVSIASGIHLLHEEYGISSIFSVLLKDIVEALTVDSADTVVSRNFSNFLAELATVAPQLMIPHLSTLGDELLSCEAHVLRNCILQIMGDAIVNELTSEELSDELKEARNEFLENLLAHINDVSAHVRSRVLQIWHGMKEEDAVPLSFQLNVLREAVERLEDKTATVRKHAVQLIKSFLERNPFAAKLTLEELKKKHTEECEKMDQLRLLVDEERKKAENVDKEWTSIVPVLLPMLKENFMQANQERHETQETYEEIVQRISGLLLEEKYQEAVVLLGKADHLLGNTELSNSLATDERCLYYMTLLKSYLFMAKGCKDSNEVFGTQIKTVQFLQDSIEFSTVITKAMPKIQALLLSKTNSDVFEAVELFTTGFQFGIKGTECGMRKMLYLVWSPDKEKRDAVSNAYKRILFNTDHTGRAHALKAVENLTSFLADLEYGHFTAMECLMREWVAADDIDAQIIQVLFERFTLKLEGTSHNDSRLALQLLIMAANANSSIAAANIGIIESIGLGERGQLDPRLYSSCLEFLLKSIDASATTKFYKRYEQDAPIVAKVRNRFQRFFFHPRVPDFDTVAKQTLDFFYRMCQAPDIIAQGIVHELLGKFRTSAEMVKALTASQQSLTSETPFSQAIPEIEGLPSDTIVASQVPTGGAGDAQFRMPVYLLTRFIFTIGYMALKEMIFLDIDVYNNMKYRQELTECEEKKKKNAFSQQIRRKTINMNMSATESLKRLSGTAAEPQQEPDEDLVGATAEDNIAELINHICEDVLLHSENSLLAKLFSYVMEICKYPAKYRDQSLQQAATLTLIRFMCVSSPFCEANMPFLMNVLNHTRNIKIKCNIVIGLSDLTFRFPNVIEPWTGHFYSTLHEDNTEVRLTAVKMLSHLILHEMILVKGQIADLAMCIVDEHDEIRNITQQFFKEIASKSNILYNVLPDIISKLSDTNLHLEEGKYHEIMRYILGLIKKDRQVETLVEKLCLRFPVTREERQWRDIAYCLSLLSYNERAIRKLLDNIHHYKDKVQVDEVHQSFKSIICATTKMAKPELKAAVAELEARINECLAVRQSDDMESGSNYEGTGSVGSSQLKRLNKTKTRAKNNTKGGRGRKKADTSSSEQTQLDSDEDDAAESSRRRQPKSGKGAKPKSAPTTRKQKTTRDISESTASSSAEETPARRTAGRHKDRSSAAPVPSTNRSQRGNHARSVVIEESASSNDNDTTGASRMDSTRQHKRGRGVKRK